MEKLRVGIIGTGGISFFHVNGYKLQSDRVTVVAACDINEEKLNRYCDQHGIEHRYTDYNEMLEKEHLDCVSVTTWNSEHKNATIAALRAGCNVLCEKPMALNAAEAKEMLDESKKAGKVLQIGFVRRFSSEADLVKERVASGEFGDIYYAKVKFVRRDGCPGGWFGDKAFSGGGPLIDLGVHIIDLARYLAGLPQPVSAYGQTFNNLGMHRAAGVEPTWEIEVNGGHPFNVEDCTTAMIKFDNGFTLLAETSFNLNTKENESYNIEIFGTKSGVSFSPRFEEFTVRDGHFVNLEPEYKQNSFGDMFNIEMHKFIDASLGLIPCAAPAEDGYALMKIIDAIYESARIGKSVKIK